MPIIFKKWGKACFNLSAEQIVAINKKRKSDGQEAISKAYIQGLVNNT
ncbi:MAG: hypothetical protein MZU97_09890 [Bacillus subtilis]|nr:hypothetical protein [Bacillus subtilis]